MFPESGVELRMKEPLFKMKERQLPLCQLKQSFLIQKREFPHMSHSKFQMFVEIFWAAQKLKGGDTIYVFKVYPWFQVEKAQSFIDLTKSAN